MVNETLQSRTIRGKGGVVMKAIILIRFSSVCVIPGFNDAKISRLPYISLYTLHTELHYTLHRRLAAMERTCGASRLLRTKKGADFSYRYFFSLPFSKTFLRIIACLDFPINNLDYNPAVALLRKS